MFCLKCGTPMQPNFLDGRSRNQCPACGYIHYENPVPGVGLIIEHGDKVIAIQRGHDPHEGDWALPSGFIEADETAEQAAVREAYEETGLDVEICELFSVHSFPEGPPRSGIIVFYRCRAKNIADMQAGDDARAVQLFTLDDFPLMCFRTHREAIDRLKVVGPYAQALSLRPSTN